MSRHYILDGKKPIPADLQTWFKWLKTAGDNRVVAKTHTRNGDVSTVFLGVNVGWWYNERLLFETLVVGGPLADTTKYYATWRGAEAGHKRMVKRVRAAATVAGAL
jgi:hypothetical protein